MRAARVGQAMTIVASAWIIVALAVAGCAETAAAPEQADRTVPLEARQAASPNAASMAVRAHGLTAELPAGWQAASESLTPHLTDPREELAVGTYPLRYGLRPGQTARSARRARSRHWLRPPQS
jgi:ABC-type protease/lipase transport system fused ATPase/permease subunit